MLFPKQFPIENDNKAERKVFLALDKLDKSNYDVFFSRKFSAIEKGERSEYEVDFIIADIRNNKLNGIIVIEVKGGRITYDGPKSLWKQNNRILNPSPTQQATSILHSLFIRFDFLPQRTPMGWAVWFPDVINPGNEYLPCELNENQYFDSQALTNVHQFVKNAFTYLYGLWPNKKGDRLENYFKFKEPLIRSLGYALPLHKKIEVAETRFLELTQKQLGLLKLISINPNILVNGPAGSGKTVMATTIAREKAEEGKKVLLLTFNRVLANNIRYGLGQVDNPEVANYHSLAKRYIDRIDPEWWNSTDKDSEFWELGVPIKMMESLNGYEPEYDIIIVDEAQDLRSEWFETLEMLVKPEGGFFVFKDQDQDIFNVNTDVIIKRSLFKFELTENCRNTVNIIHKLKEYVDRKIDFRADAVEGEPVKVIEFVNDTDQMNKIKNEWLRLVEDESISPDKILILMNTDKRSSCLSTVKKFGKYKVSSLQGRTGQLDTKSVNYTSIKVFKGLEVDVVMIIDTDKVNSPDLKILYAQASRAKYYLQITKKTNS